MGDEEFRLPGSSYEELVKIIMGYGNVTTDVAPGDVGRVIGMHETQVSRNNAFLVATGIVEGGRRKTITPFGTGLARALEHSQVDEVSKCWHKVVSTRPFFQKILAAVRIRRGMDASTLQAHVAYSAGQKKNAAVIAGAAAVIQIMQVAGVLRVEADKLVVVDEVPSGLEQPRHQTDEAAGRPQEAPTDLISHVNARPTSGPVSVQVQLQIHCRIDELDDIAAKLRSLVDVLTASQPEAQ